MHRKQLSRAKLTSNNSVKRIVLNNTVKVHTGTVVIEEGEHRPLKDNNLLSSSYIRNGSYGGKAGLQSKQLS